MPFGLPKFLLLPALALTCALAPTPINAQTQIQTLTLAIDHATSPARQVVNLTATLQGTPTPGASVLFYDYADPIYTLPLPSTRSAVLSIASLPTGTHNLSARYTPAGSPNAIVSQPVAVTITPLASTFTIGTDTVSPLAGNALTFIASALPAGATGTLQFSENGNALASALITGTQVPYYQAFGDSITFGATLASGSQRYPTVLASALGLSLSDLGVPGAIACDLLPTQILRRSTQATQAATPLSSLLIGTNDVDFWGTGAYESIFHTCHQAALAWLAIPREYKVLSGDPAATPISGTWTHQPNAFDATYGTLYNSTGIGTARFVLTSSGGPLYLWYLLRDSIRGTFTLTLDGLPSSAVYSTQPSHFIGSVVNPDGVGFALIRLPVAPGRHQVDINVASGTVGILGLGTPPTPGTASVHPIVLVGDLPPQLLTNPVSSPAAQARYTQDILDDLTLLQADGLDLRSVPTGQFLHATPPEMDDQVHPSALGHAHLATAFQTAIPSTVPFTTFVNNSVAVPVSFGQPGTHRLDVTYSGDSIYAPSTHSLTVNLLAKASTAVSLSTSATTAFAGSPIVFSVTVVPAAAGGTLSLWDGTQFLDQAGVVNNAASFTVSTLPPGTHSIFALYSGDYFSQASQSPPLTLTISPAPSALKLAPLPAHLAFGSPLTLSATLVSVTATGTVTFNDSYVPFGNPVPQPQVTLLGQSPLVKGAAALTPPTLLPGTHTLSAAYSGDSANSSSAATNLIVTVDLLSTTITLAPPQAPLFYGAPVHFAATVLPTSSTGTVTFSDGSALLAQSSLSAGTASFTSSSLTPGAHAITAAYAGDGTHAPSTSATLVNQVNPAASTITLAPLAATLTLGNPLTLTTSLTPATATGTVLFVDASAGILGQSPVSGGIATLLLPALPAASYSITATYSGDPLTAPATSAPISTHVILTPTTTTLAPLAATLPYASPITLAATVSPAPATAGITFSDNGQPLATLPALNGTATFTLSTLPVGPHAFTATFPGNELDAPSTSSPASLSITTAGTSTTLSLAQVAIPAGSPVFVNVRVASTSTNIPTGTVTLRSGATLLARASLANGTPGQAYATLQAPPPATLGTFPIVVLYSGDPNDTPSDSAANPTAFTVLGTPTTSILTLSATQVPPQTPITLTVSLTSATHAIPTGTVTFLSGATALGTASLDSTGKASLSLASRPVGAYSIAATLAPTGLFAASTAPAQILSVTAPLAVALASPALKAAPGASISTTITLTPLSGFQGTVVSVCQSPVSYVTCTLDMPATLASSPATGTIHISIRPSTNASLQILQTRTTLATALALLLPFVLARRSRRRLPVLLTLTLLLVTLTSTLAGCAEGGNFGTIPPGTELLHINVTAAGTTTSSAFTVTIQ